MITAKFNPPRNTSEVWRFLPDPDVREQYVAIAQAFWRFDVNNRKVHFAFTTDDLVQRFGFSACNIREIQRCAGVLQPPLNTEFKVECVGDCGCSLNWARFKSRTDFQKFIRRSYQCNDCGAKAAATQAAEWERQRVAAEKNRIANAATRKKQTRDQLPSYHPTFQIAHLVEPEPQACVSDILSLTDADKQFLKSVGVKS